MPRQVADLFLKGTVGIADDGEGVRGCEGGLTMRQGGFNAGGAKRGNNYAGA